MHNLNLRKSKIYRTGVLFINLSVDFILTVYILTKPSFCASTKVLRFIKPRVRQNQRKNPFINPSQGTIVRMCISTMSPPRNQHIWILQRLLLVCITSSAYHFHAYSHPLDTMGAYQFLFVPPPFPFLASFLRVLAPPLQDAREGRKEKMRGWRN